MGKKKRHDFLLLGPWDNGYEAQSSTDFQYRIILERSVKVEKRSKGGKNHYESIRKLLKLGHHVKFPRAKRPFQILFILSCLCLDIQLS